jgi:hypothetical protein
MAVKKTTKSSGTKAAPKKAAAKKAAPKASAASVKAAPKKKAAPKASGATAKAAPKKKAAPVRLTDKQTDLLRKIADTKEGGYIGSKGEVKALESLQTKKLIKRGAKDKASGNYRYMVSKAGEKHVNTPPPASS